MKNEELFMIKSDYEKLVLQVNDYILYGSYKIS